jgi:hypothetical protein
VITHRGVIESVKPCKGGKSTKVEMSGMYRVLWVYGLVPNHFQKGLSVEVQYELLLIVNTYKQAWVTCMKEVETKKSV